MEGKCSEQGRQGGERDFFQTSAFLFFHLVTVRGREENRKSFRKGGKGIEGKWEKGRRERKGVEKKRTKAMRRRKGGQSFNKIPQEIVCR